MTKCFDSLPDNERYSGEKYVSIHNPIIVLTICDMISICIVINVVNTALLKYRAKQSVSQS